MQRRCLISVSNRLSFAMLALLLFQPACGDPQPSAETSESHTKARTTEHRLSEELTREPPPTLSDPVFDFSEYDLGPSLEAAFSCQLSRVDWDCYQSTLEELRADRQQAFKILSKRYASLDAEDVYLIPDRERLIGLITDLDEPESIPFFVDIITSPIPEEVINTDNTAHQWSNVEDELNLRIMAVMSLGRYVANGVGSVEALEEAFIGQEDFAIRYSIAMEMVLRGTSRNDVQEFASTFGADGVEEVFERPAPTLDVGDSIPLNPEYEADDDEQTEQDLYPAPEVTNE